MVKWRLFCALMVTTKILSEASCLQISLQRKLNKIENLEMSMTRLQIFVVQRNICETMGIEIVQDTAKKISGGCMTFHNGLCTEPLR